MITIKSLVSGLISYRFERFNKVSRNSGNCRKQSTSWHQMAWHRVPRGRTKRRQFLQILCAQRWPRSALLSSYQFSIARSDNRALLRRRRSRRIGNNECRDRMLDRAYESKTYRSDSVRPTDCLVSVGRKLVVVRDCSLSRKRNRFDRRNRTLPTPRTILFA